MSVRFVLGRKDLLTYASFEVRYGYPEATESFPTLIYLLTPFIHLALFTLPSALLQCESDVYPLSLLSIFAWGGGMLQHIDACVSDEEF